MKYLTTLALVVGLSTAANAQQVLTPPTTNYTFSWDAPTGPEPVTDYQWQVQPGATFASVGLTKSKVLPALANGSYTAQSRACNTSGCGVATSLAFTVGTTAPAVPGATSNLTLTFIPPTGNVASYRSHATTTYATRSAATNVTKPIGTASGDTLILVFVDGRNPAPTATITAPAGFSPLPGFPSSVIVDGFQVDLRAYYKTAGSSEPTSYAVSHSGTALSTQALLIAATGGAGVPTVTLRKGTGLTSTATGITTPVANTLAIFVDQNWELYGTSTPPAGTTPTWTERSDLSSSLLYLATGVLPTAGPTGNPTHGNQNITAAEAWQTLLLTVTP